VSSDLRSVRGRAALLLLGLALTVLVLAQAVHRARAGRSALIKWRPAIERLASGESPYGVDARTGREGFPTLPLTGLALRPFLALGDTSGALAWACFKLALAWYCLLGVLRLAAGRARDVPPWAAALVVLLSVRTLASDVSHGNVNLPIAAVLIASALDWRAGRELRAGVWIGLGAVLKATPLLFAAYFCWKKSSRAVVGLGLGLLLFAFALPGALLGWERNGELAQGWWQQMAAPYLAGSRLGVTQTEHVNQSLLGVLARWCTDSVAIPARPPQVAQDVRINVLALSPEAFRWLHRAACALVLLAALAASRAPRAQRDSDRTLGEWALFALAMLFVSERSWKQHYVTLCLPLAYLCWRLAREPAGARDKRIAAGSLVLAALCLGASGSGVAGSLGSDYAESWGVFLLGGLALFAATAALLVRSSPAVAADRPPSQA
jgi:hypothetical protein